MSYVWHGTIAPVPAVAITIVVVVVVVSLSAQRNAKVRSVVDWLTVVVFFLHPPTTPSCCFPFASLLLRCCCYYIFTADVFLTMPALCSIVTFLALFSLLFLQ